MSTGTQRGLGPFFAAGTGAVYRPPAAASARSAVAFLRLAAGGRGLSSAALCWASSESRVAMGTHDTGPPLRRPVRLGNRLSGRDPRPVACRAVALSILVIDNYDSFVYNLVQYIGETGAEPVVRRHDQLELSDVEDLSPDGILISPGPGTPDDAGLSNSVIERYGPRIPTFGVCLGLQCMAQVFGGDVVRAPEIVHGKTSLIRHDGAGVFSGLPDPLEATRYHSLIVEPASVPEVLEVNARTDDGLVMGLRHREHPIHGVQFHPESVLSTGGHEMVENFLALCR